MVLKRKLPSAMAAKGIKKEDISSSQTSAPTIQKPPLAPQPNMEKGISAIPDTQKVEKSFVSKELPDNDFDLDSPPSQPTKKASTSASSWDEEPVEAGGWELDGLGKKSSPDDDVFGSMAEDVKKEEESKEPLPPWQQGAGTMPAPELPSDIAAAGIKSQLDGAKSSGPMGALMGIALLVLIGFGGYQFFIDKDGTTEVISRWTGSLNEVSEEIPTTLNASQNSEKTDTLLKPETVVTMSDKKPVHEIIPEPSEPMEDEITAEMNSVKDEASMDMSSMNMNATENQPSPFDVDKADNKTVVEFINVAEDEVEKPINAEGSSDMPQEVGMIVELQQAISEARKEKNPDNYKGVEKEVQVVKTETEALEMLTPDELDERNRELSSQLDAELAEYRKILAGDSTNDSRKVTPTEFFDGTKTEEASLLKEAGSIPLPKRGSALLSQQQAESLYGANPHNLPIVPEPSQQTGPSVRSLSDFDVSMFQVERERVRIPKNIRPTFRSTSFPPILLLSTVRQKGIIAEMDDKQGVLLIGESISGWELLAVKAEYAEFSNGKIKHIVSIGR